MDAANQRADDRTWRPHIGAWPLERGFRFRVWAPDRKDVVLVLDPDGTRRRLPLERQGDGTFALTVAGAAAGDRYAYELDGQGPFPDPASRAQPDGVHRPSALVDPRPFRWSDRDWRGVALEQAVVYELHVGTFTAAGTFAAAADRLSYLAELGVTVVELMPLGDFPGRWNWGYDGVSLFAPARCYGTPDDLRRFVDEAHGLGLAVMVDVVYNHFGPDGAYFTVFSPYYQSTRHTSPWGAAVNLDGEHAGHVRAFFIENALHWVHEYHADGLRLDATHGLIDDGPCHFARELAMCVRGSVADRTLLLIAEDERNLAPIVMPAAEGGWGMDAVWADDLHHQVRRLSAGDTDGYYQDYSGTLADIATTLRQGWFYRGQMSAYLGKIRGTDPSGISLRRMVVCIQNHDQIGNRPFGRRLNHQIDAAMYRAVSAMLLLAPETPLLFMGQEWAASAKFLFFTDHHPELGRLVTEGRRKEFSRFAAFADEETRARIPDPQAPATFEGSRLIWDELDRMPHSGTLELYRALLRLRRHEAALQGTSCDVKALDDHSLLLRRTGAAGQALLLVLGLRAGGVDCRPWRTLPADSRWTVALTTDDAPYVEGEAADAASRPEIDVTSGPPIVTFHRPGAVILR